MVYYFTSQVFFIFIVLYTVEIVSKHLHSIKQESNGINYANFKYEANLNPVIKQLTRQQYHYLDPVSSVLINTFQ